LSLDGIWEVGESVASDAPPKEWNHKVPVPGLVNLAQPGFPDVDRFDSRELIDNKVRKKLMPPSERTPEVGRSRQSRNYFWYRKTFRPTAGKRAAILKVNKAQFGTAVFLNGKPIGEHPGCFTAGYFDMTKSIRWSGENELVIRIGAHPGVLPRNIPAGTDFEKLKWTPGIYDSVSAIFTEGPVIETLQVAPRIGRSEALVQTKLRNYGSTPATLRLVHRVTTWQGRAPAGSGDPLKVTLQPGETRTVDQIVRIPSAHLWSPEDPFRGVPISPCTGSSKTRWQARSRGTRSGCESCWSRSRNK
jgi:hypothetical protein